MNFLALVNRARQECGVSGPPITTLAMLTVEGQRFSDWIAQAWTDVQEMRTDWQWMRKDLSFQTTAGVIGNSYSPAAIGSPDVAEYVRSNFRVYLTAGGSNAEQFMTYWDWGDFRDAYVFSSPRNVLSMPLNITVKPDHSLMVWPNAANVYTIVGEYYRIPTDLLVDSDDPSSPGNDLPTRFHLLLVGLAMRSYAAYESAPEVDARGIEWVNRYRGRLELWGIRAATMGGSLC